MEYLFAYAAEKARKQGYASLAEHERWDWHGDVYGWRRVVLGVSADERTSPCDPEGKWFDAARAKMAEDHHRARLYGGAQRRERAAQDIAFEARDIENRWARDRGYNDFEHYKDAERLDHTEACKVVAISILARGLLRNRDALKEPADNVNDRFDIARSLGVRSREYTADELRAGRAALGMEPADAAE